MILIPLAIWTLAGLIALWPGDISSHVNADVAGYSVAGVTYPTARITSSAQISCEGLAGSTPGVSDTRCANATAELLDGDDKGKAVDRPADRRGLLLRGQGRPGGHPDPGAAGRRISRRSTSSPTSSAGRR